MVTLKLKTQRKYFLFSGRTQLTYNQKPLSEDQQQRVLYQEMQFSELAYVGLPYQELQHRNNYFSVNYFRNIQFLGSGSREKIQESKLQQNILLHLQRVKNELNFSIHAFVWGESSVSLLFSLDSPKENIQLLDFENKFFHFLGFELEKPCLCEPLWNQNRIWNAYQQAFQLSVRDKNKKIDSFNIILKGHPLSYLFEDQLNLVVNPFSTIKALNYENSTVEFKKL